MRRPGRIARTSSTRRVSGLLKGLGISPASGRLASTQARQKPAHTAMPASRSSSRLSLRPG